MFAINYKLIINLIIKGLFILTDTERCYSESIDELCQKYGKTFTWEVKAKQMGQKEVVSARIAIGKHFSFYYIIWYPSFIKTEKSPTNLVVNGT